MTARRLILLLIVVVVLLLGLWYVSSPGSPPSGVGAAPASQHAPESVTPAPQIDPGPWQHWLSQWAQQVQQSTTVTTPDQMPGILAQARRGEINLFRELKQIRAQCPEDWDREHCNRKTRDFIQERIQASDQADLLALYDDYIAYEDFLAATRPLQGLDPQATYETLQRIRRQFFADEVRAWLFGAENARMSYEVAKQRFFDHEAISLDPRQRLVRLDEIRRDTLGHFYKQFAEQEDPRQHLYNKLQLLQLDVTYSEEAEQLTADILAQLQSLEPANHIRAESAKQR